MLKSPNFVLCSLTLSRVGITAGESTNPRKAVPRAIKQVFWRILIFYVGMIFFIGILMPWNDKQLLSGSSKTASSPLTIALTDAGILPAAHLINALIVISVISAGNSSLYVASRTLLFMSRNGKAPKFIGRTNRAGVPWVGLIFTNVFACIVFLEQSASAGTVYSALITLSGGMYPFLLLVVSGYCANSIQSLLSLSGPLLESAIFDSAAHWSLKAKIHPSFHTKLPSIHTAHTLRSLRISSSCSSKDTRASSIRSAHRTL